MGDKTYREIELKNVNFSKCILMLFVILGHSLDLWTERGWFVYAPIESAPVLGLVADWLTSFHIYAFVLISGYTFFFLKNEKDRYSKYKNFILSKMKRLLVPYVFILCVWVIPIAKYFFEYDAKEIVNRFLLGTAPNQLWFLLMLFWVYAISWLLNSVLKKSYVIGLLIVVVFYGVGVIGNHITYDYFNFWSACKYLLFFWIGYQLRKRGTLSIKKIPIYIWLIFDLLLFGGARLVSGFLGQILGVVLHICGSIMAFLVLDWLATKVRWVDSSAFLGLIKCSMPMYLVHQQIVYVCIMVTNGKMNPYLNAIVIYVITIIISLIISCTLMYTRITRFLIGEK